AELEAMAAALPGSGHRALVADLAEPGAAERLVGDAGPVDVLVANAGLPGTGRLEHFVPEEIERALRVNLEAPIRLARALLPAMRERGRGHMVFISSLAGKAPAPRSSMYSATKFGLRGFALGLREDLRGSGVGVSVIAPGFIRGAGMFAKTEVKLPPGVGTRSPQDVADAVLRAIESNRAEVDVAPLGLRAGAWFGSVAPGLAGWASDKLGS